MDSLQMEYQPKRKIKNYKDLRIEQDRLNLHQEFLGELLHRDKLLLKESLRPTRLAEEFIADAWTDTDEKKGTTSSAFSSFSILKTLVKWLIHKFV